MKGRIYYSRQEKWKYGEEKELSVDKEGACCLKHWPLPCVHIHAAVVSSEAVTIKFQHT
jgi:plastocyanin domain-containing protein